MTSILNIKNLSKSYNGIPALKNVSLSVRAGEIHGIVGANGSGKTTLMNILFGNPVIRETGGYQGEIYYEGVSLKTKNSTEIIDLGIGMVHQEFALIPDLTIGENIKLGREETNRFTDRLFGKKYSFVDREKNDLKAESALKKLGLNVDVGVKTINLSTNTRQFVEIAREIARVDLKLLLLDEPTAVLSRDDALNLLEVLTELSQDGLGILFVSHRLEEIQQFCDRVTVLREGEVISQYGKGEVSTTELARDMIGHTVSKAMAEKRAIEPRPLVSFQRYSVEMPGEEIRGMDLDIFEGEILGLAGLSGHGKSALGYGVMGMYPVAGEVVYENIKIDRMDAKANIIKGIFVLPDDRQALGILPDHSLAENIIFTGDQIKGLFSMNLGLPLLGFIDKKKVYDHVHKLVDDFEIRCASVKQKIKELSGGNQQKVCIARALTVNPRLLFVAEPTRGVDISAKEKILKMLIDINRSRHTTIVIASSELDELKRVCDRIAVMVEGRIFKVLQPDSPDVEFAMALAGEEGTDYDA